MSFSVEEAVAGAETPLPPLLREIPEPPERLTYRGQLPPAELKLLSVVGSRRYTRYGADVVAHLIKGLVGYPVGIVSGLALGIDSLAHEAALTHNLYTLAIPGSGLDDSVLYPRKHRPLARRIMENGGGLLSEFAPDFAATPWSFPRRNRLIAGVSHATLVIEAAEQSGSLITARLAADYNRELLVVPGSIFSDNSRGTHQFLKLGATPVTEAVDILAVLGVEEQAALTESAPPANLPSNAAVVVQLLREPTERDVLIRQLNLPTAEATALLAELELMGTITQRDGIYRRA
jgi:DNA processing protein